MKRSMDVPVGRFLVCRASTRHRVQPRQLLCHAVGRPQQVEGGARQAGQRVRQSRPALLQLRGGKRGWQRRSQLLHMHMQAQQRALVPHLQCVHVAPKHRWQGCRNASAGPPKPGLWHTSSVTRDATSARKPHPQVVEPAVLWILLCSTDLRDTHTSSPAHHGTRPSTQAGTKISPGAVQESQAHSVGPHIQQLRFCSHVPYRSYWPCRHPERQHWVVLSVGLQAPIGREWGGWGATGPAACGSSP